MSGVRKYSRIWLAVAIAATLAPRRVSVARIVFGPSPQSQVAMLRAELLVIDTNLGCARNDLLQALSDIACDADPPYVGKMIAENRELGQCRAFASMAEQAVEDAKSKLDPASQRMQLYREQAIRLRRRAEEYEADLRAREREFVVSAYTESVARLESYRDDTRRRLAMWARRAQEEEAGSPSPTAAP